MGSNLPSPDVHMEVLYRQTFNTLGGATTMDMTQDNRVGNTQKTGNDRLNASTNKGLLAGSVVAVVGDGLIGACPGDSTLFDKAVGLVVNDALGRPYESSSAVASEKIVYAHGSGTVVRTDIYETKAINGSSDITYTSGDRLVSSRNGLLTNSQGLDQSNSVGTTCTVVGVLLNKPTGTDPYMTVQLRI